MSERSVPTGQKMEWAKHSPYARYAFRILFLISFVNSLDRFVIVGAQGAVAQDLGLSLDQIGFLASAFLVVYTLAP